MKRKTIVTLFLLMATAAVSACEFSYSSASIADATLAKDVSADKEPIGPTNTFATDVPVIHCVVRLANAPADTRVRAVWSIVNVPGEQPNRKIVESDVDNAGSGKNIIDFTFTPNQGLPPGEYKVDIHLNPKADKTDPPAKTLTFTVKE
ncbi:MAG TPA: hypothetical protein VJQ56_08145 [Blastocatellia bacterium]|nr:hypothetical protein [Blastocatellia bacterium]